MTLPPQLVEALRARRLILFAGAGLSAGLGLPTWSQLLDHMATDLGYDPRIFRTLGDPWTLAEYYRIQRRGLGGLRSWMDTKWHAAGVEIGKSDLHRLVVELDFAAVYTTNYDRWIERAYAHHGKPFVRILTLQDLGTAGASPKATPIVKFHGDFDDDATLVLTETHFLRRFDLDEPLDVRLRHDLFAHSVLFVGYSLTDPNVRRLLYKLRTVWSAAGLAANQLPLFVFNPFPNPVQETVLAEWGVRTVTEEADHPGEALLAFFHKLREAAPRAAPP